MFSVPKEKNFAATLKSENTWKEHEESIHDGITHSCDFCEMTFTTKGHLRTHIKKVHNETG